MWLGHVPWAGRHWALPVLTVLAPSTRYYQQQGRRHKKLTDWARQMVMQLRRWLPQRPLVLVGDNSYAVLDLLHCCQSLREPVTLIARLRLDAALYAPARQPGQNGRPPLKGARGPALKTILDQPQATWASVAVAWYDGTTRTVELTSQTAVWYRSGKPPVLIRWVLIRDPQGSFATQALLCTDPAADPTQILEWFVLRWQLGGRDRLRFRRRHNLQLRRGVRIPLEPPDGELVGKRHRGGQPDRLKQRLAWNAKRPHTWIGRGRPPLTRRPPLWRGGLASRAHRLLLALLLKGKRPLGEDKDEGVALPFRPWGSGGASSSMVNSAHPGASEKPAPSARFNSPPPSGYACPLPSAQLAQSRQLWYCPKTVTKLLSK